MRLRQVLTGGLLGAGPVLFAAAVALFAGYSVVESGVLLGLAAGAMLLAGAALAAAWALHVHEVTIAVLLFAGTWAFAVLVVFVLFMTADLYGNHVQ